MSDEQRNDGPHYGANDEPGDEVEAHGPHYGANDEQGDEVEGHRTRAGANDEAEADDDEVEGHATGPAEPSGTSFARARHTPGPFSCV